LASSATRKLWPKLMASSATRKLSVNVCSLTSLTNLLTPFLASSLGFGYAGHVWLNRIVCKSLSVDTEWGIASIKGSSIVSILFLPDLKWNATIGSNGKRWMLVDSKSTPTASGPVVPSGLVLSCTTLRVVGITTRSVVQLSLPTQVFRLDDALDSLGM